MVAKARGFVVLDLLALGVALAVGGALIAPAMQQARRSANDAVNASNMRQLGMAWLSYATDYQDRIATFSWSSDPNRRGHSQYADLQALAASVSPADAAAAQAIDAIRRRAGREDIPAVKDWLPHANYSTLVVQDYLASRLPEPLIVSTHDEHRLAWQEANGSKFDRGTFLPHQPAATPENKIYPYSSSYTFTVAGFDWNASRLEGAAAPLRVRQGDTWGQFLVPGNARLGGLRYSEVRFPSQKVAMFDGFDRAKPEWKIASDPVAVIASGYYDGSVRSSQGSEMNPGWDPWQPQSASPTVFRFKPQPWERGAKAERDATEGYFVGGAMWTRGGLKGLDAEGPEAQTGQPQDAPARTAPDANAWDAFRKAADGTEARRVEAK